MEFNSNKSNGIKIPGLSSGLRNYFYLKLNIDSLDITFKQCDDFGIIFKPFLEIQITGQEAAKINTLEEEKLNLSFSSISNENDNSRYDKLKSFISGKSIINNSSKEKKFNFKAVNFF
jgi:hypothetical protein